MAKLTRHLNFDSQYLGKSNGVIPLNGEKKCLACVLNKVSETPLKYDCDKLKKYEEEEIKQKKKVSTDSTLENERSVIVKEEPPRNGVLNGELPLEENHRKSLKNNKKKKKNKSKKNSQNENLDYEKMANNNRDFEDHNLVPVTSKNHKNGVIEPEKELTQEKIAIAHQLNDILRTYSKTILFDEVSLLIYRKLVRQPWRSL